VKTLIIGAGEIGKSLRNILIKHYETYILDKEPVTIDGLIEIYPGEEYQPEIMHICFPYSDKFIDAVKNYKLKYNPKFTVIHSTVPVGTSRKLDAIHSPCMGIHPDLTKSMLTFTKYLSGEKASEVAQYFRRSGMKVYLTDKQETTELMKILSTSFYGACIEWTKEVKRLCNENDVPFEFWTLWTENYNSGYEKLGHSEFRRPNLIPIKTKIGGHCVLPNLEFINSKFADFIKKQNE
jgi:hypothetical protein